MELDPTIFVSSRKSSSGASPSGMNAPWRSCTTSTLRSCSPWPCEWSARVASPKRSCKTSFSQCGGLRPHGMPTAARCRHG